MYGQAWNWMTNCFEDFNGFVKGIIKGTNKIDIEVANTLKICNSYGILKHRLGATLEKKKTNDEDKFTNLLEKYLTPAEKNRIIDFCSSQNISFESIKFSSRVNLRGEIFTSVKYDRQKKRGNSQICWSGNDNENQKFGQIQLFFHNESRILSLVRELVPCSDSTSLNGYIRSPKIHILVRPSYCLHIVDVREIKYKVIKVINYVCVPEFVGKR